MRFRQSPQGRSCSSPNHQTCQRAASLPPVRGASDLREKGQQNPSPRRVGQNLGSSFDIVLADTISIYYFILFLKVLGDSQNHSKSEITIFCEPDIRVNVPCLEVQTTATNHALNVGNPCDLGSPAVDEQSKSSFLESPRLPSLGKCQSKNVSNVQKRHLCILLHGTPAVLTFGRTSSSAFCAALSEAFEESASISSCRAFSYS